MARTASRPIPRGTIAPGEVLAVGSGLALASTAALAVSQDKDGAAAAKPAFERMNLRTLKLYLDAPRALTREIGARGLPTTIIFGPEGEPLSYREGAAEWDSQDFVRYLESLSSAARRSRNTVP